MCRRKNRKERRRGMVMFLSLVFVALFASMAFAMLAMSSRNVKVADNHRHVNRVFETALSGIEVTKYWLDQVAMPGSTAPSDRFSVMSAQLGSYMTIDAENTLSSSGDASFCAQLLPVDNERFRVRVIGTTGQLRRGVDVDYTFGVREETVFDFGVATRGPLELSGNIQLDGTNIAVESDVYIESDESNVLSIIGNSQIAGDVKLTSETGTVVLQGGKASIGGETGQAAIDNHVERGVAPTEFPVPNTGHFEPYLAGGDVITAATDLSKTTTFTNVRVAAGTNPCFTANTKINGVMFVETPNVVTFAGNCSITGLIVGDGDMNDDSGTNQLIFLGSVDSQPVTALEGSQFDDLRQETGTFVMAPGFRASFGGSFETLNGVIAANGIEFFGNAGGTIAGSVINYARTPMTLSGNSDLFFNRSGITEVPAGFEPEIILHYDPSSYNEVLVQ